MPNRSTAWKVALHFHAAIGLLALIGLVIGAFVLSREISQEDRKDFANKSDVLFVFAWAELPPEQQVKIVGSFSSRRSFTGDHLEAYCIRFSHADTDGKWVPWKALEKPFGQAVEFGLDFARQELSCIPSLHEVEAGGFLVKPYSLYFSHGHATGGDILLIDPATNSLYFVGFKV
jgi:hypothetical protein